MQIFSASDDKTIRILKKPKKMYYFHGVGNLRLILEVLKFLSPKEVVGIARVNKRFYEASFHPEVYKPFFMRTGFVKTRWPISSIAVCMKKRLLLCGVQNNIQVRNLANGFIGRTTKPLKGHSDGVYSVAISSDGEWAVSGVQTKHLEYGI